MFFRRSPLLLLILFLAIPAIARAAGDPGERYLRLIEGDVQMQGEDSPEWVPAAANTPLLEGDKLWVPQDGKAEVRFRDGMSVRLGPLTAIEIGPTDDGNHELYVDQGAMYVNHTVPGTSPLIVYTPGTMLRADGEAIFDVHAPENGEIEVSVLSGSVYASPGSGEMRIDAGYRLTLRDQGNYPVLTGLRPEDDWIRWNRNRDHEAYGVAQGAASRYLPEELNSYGPDLDRNGRWVYAPDYGYVWTPTVIVTSDWSPYRVGRWVWIKGDYVWVSYEPWGWAPYHYGRWAHLPRVGWCWVPPARGAAYWAPAYVGWVHTPTHVAWVPLAPRETYYGRGHFGPHSFDISHGSTGVSRPTYRNTHVTNAVTTVTTNVFLAGRPAQSRVKENLFLKERTSLGAPGIAPVHASMMPVIKDIPQAKKPPERFRDAHPLSDERRQAGWRGQAVQGSGPRDSRGKEMQQNAPPLQRQPDDRLSQPGHPGQGPDMDRRRVPGQLRSQPGGQAREPSRPTGPAPTPPPNRNAVKPGDRNMEQDRIGSEKDRIRSEQGRMRQERDRPGDRQATEAGGARAGRVLPPAMGTNRDRQVEPGLAGSERTREQATRRVGPLNRPRDSVQENPPVMVDRPAVKEDNALGPDTRRPPQVTDRTPTRQTIRPPVQEQRSVQVSPPHKGEANDQAGPGRNNGNARPQASRGPERGEGGTAPQNRPEPAITQQEQQHRAASQGPPRAPGRNRQEQEKQQATNRQDPQKGGEARQEQREESVQGGPAAGREPVQGRVGVQGEGRNPPRMPGEQPGPHRIAR